MLMDKMRGQQVIKLLDFIIVNIMGSSMAILYYYVVQLKSVIL